MRYKNPILRGFHPDPSICRVGEDFYLVTSSFTYFPAVPVYRSRNLTDWTLVGHCLTRDSQLNMEKTPNSKGIYAPTLRWHDGRFFMITTDVTGKGNLIVHAEKAEGPWSEPVLIDQNGIDPSLFWDEDGSCWYCGKGRLDGKRGIIAFQLNPMTGEILSEKYNISRGCGGKCAEGPHIYKKDGWYYLMTAEGGTQYSHRAVIARSRTITGGYEPCPHNPLLSHEELNWKAIQAVGHADLVEDGKGNWWGVCLGIRMFGDILLHNLGRESFLVPVQWKNGWPYMGENGTVSLTMDGPLPEMKTESAGHGPSAIYDSSASRDLTALCGLTAIRGLADEREWKFPCKEQEMSGLPEELLSIRGCFPENYRQEKGKLVLRGTEIGLNDENGSPTCLLRTQEEFDTTATACLNLKECGDGRFGMTVYYSNFNHYDAAVTKKNDRCSLMLYRHIFDIAAEEYVFYLDPDAERLWLQVRASASGYDFYYRIDDNPQSGGSQNDGHWNHLGHGTIAAMCTEAMMERSYTGTMIGLFAEEGDAVFEDGFSIESRWQGDEVTKGMRWD